MSGNQNQSAAVGLFVIFLMAVAGCVCGGALGAGATLLFR